MSGKINFAEPPKYQLISERTSKPLVEFAIFVFKKNAKIPENHTQKATSKKGN